VFSILLRRTFDSALNSSESVGHLTHFVRLDCCYALFFGSTANFRRSRPVWVAMCLRVIYRLTRDDDLYHERSPNKSELPWEKEQNLSHNQAIRVGHFQVQFNRLGTDGEIRGKNGYWNTYQGLG